MSGLEDVNWAMFLTPQEKCLIGSTPEPRYIDKFYTPKAVQRGYDISIADSIRQSAQTYPGLVTYFFNDNGENPKPDRSFSTRVVLAPLNETGETIHDPKALDEAFFIEEIDKKIFKFRS